ncbi:MAG: heparinase II/III family protein [Alphaproteobacteria bacterium]|nr:heparinase II/III family protein [Alphaproteobacteria bacterium]
MSLLSDILDPSRNHGAMRLIARPLYSWSLASGAVPDRLLMLPPDPWAGDAGKGRWITNRTIDDNGHQTMLDAGVWNRNTVTADKRQCTLVHGFEWLADLKALGGDASRRLGRQLMQEWMASNMRWQEGAWDNAITARRIAAWLMGYEFFCASGDDAFLRSFFDSLTRQLRHLDRVHPEKNLGTDALRIIRALVYGGLCLEGAENRLAAGLNWLEHWLHDEIDSEGMHISRSPRELVDIAHILIDIRGALVRGGLAAPTSLQSAIDRTMHAIRFFRMPDGRLTCFHTTQEDDATRLDTLLRVSGVRIRKPLSHLEGSGFESLVRERTVLIADCGTSAPWPYDSCAHASTLAFEMSVGRDRMIVNCGTHPVDSMWADHLRATAAHSGLTIDDRNAFEIRADGHIGRAPHNTTTRRDVVQGGGLMLTMAHDGYAPLNGIVHTRRLMLSTDGAVLEGEDWLVSDAPLVKPVNFAIRFHLHPRVQASLIQDGQAALLRLPSGGGWRFSKKAGELALETSVYCGTGATPRKTQQLVLTGVAEQGNTAIGWTFSEE